MYRFKTTTAEQKEAVFALRHRVYCEEKAWIPANPLGLEFDDWDHFSIHVAAFDEGGDIVGTVRIVEDSLLGFPYEKAIALPDNVNRRALYEVSRLAVAEQERGQRSIILVGMVRAVWRITNRLDKREWCAVVDRPVSVLLKRLGFRFRYEGEPVFHLGSMSVPLICMMEDSFAVLFTKKIDKLLADQIEEIYGEE